MLTSILTWWGAPYPEMAQYLLSKKPVFKPILKHDMGPYLMVSMRKATQ